jgi:foldase protein PrsA
MIINYCIVTKEGRNNMRKKIVLIMATSIMLSICGCSKDSNNSSNIADKTLTNAAEQEPLSSATLQALSGEIIVTVNNLEVSYDELRMYLQSNKEEIESIYGVDVWDMAVNDDDERYEEMIKKALLEEIIYIKLVCSQAEELGISLTEDELLDVDEYTAEFLSNFNDESMKYYEVNQEVVRQIYKDNMLSNKVFESLTLNVDTQVSEEESRQAVFQYILVGKYGYDQEGNRYEYSEEQLAEAKIRAEELHKQALTTTDFYDFALANTDDEDEVEIIVGKGDMQIELEAVALSLKTGELSEILDTSDGYFIFYCVEEMNQEETDAKKEEIIRERQEETFNKMYKEWDAAKQVTLNQEIWDTISLAGEIVR